VGAEDLASVLLGCFQSFETKQQGTRDIWRKLDQPSTPQSFRANQQEIHGLPAGIFHVTLQTV
jgi:hypothetical protein